MQHVFLIDGSGFIFRAFHALPMMNRADGTPTNAVYGFTRMLMKLLSDTKADYIAVVFDKGRKTFRNDLYTEYKANRTEPPPELAPQFALVHEAVRALNVAEVSQEGYEADDLIATYTRLACDAGADITIVSSDKDLMQLVGERVVMWDAMKEQEIGPEQVKEKFGVPPEKVIEVQALAGDSSDNVPGVPGIGVKTAAQLLQEYGDLDTLLARAHEIKQPKRREALIAHAENARISRTLVTLKDDVPVKVGLEAFKVKKPDPDVLLKFLRDQSFRTLTTQMEEKFGRAPPSGAAAAAARGKGAAAQAPKPKAPVRYDNRQKDYALVQTRESLERWVASARETGWVALDVQGTSEEPMRSELVGISLSNAAGRACYIPISHKSPKVQGALDLGAAPDAETLFQISLDDAIRILKPLLEDASVLKVGHDIKYAMTVLAGHGLGVAPIDDTMLISYVLDGGRHGHDGAELAERHLNCKTMPEAEVLGSGKAKVTFDQVSLEKALSYAAEDCDTVACLHAVLKPRLVQERMVTVYETLERPLLPVLLGMERKGIRVDATKLEMLSRDLGRRVADLETEIYKLAGEEFNVGSPKQLGEILFDKLALGGGKKGKTGAYTTSADVLEELAAEGHELPERVLSWRQLSKLKSTYTDTLQQQINPRTGRVHTSYAQAVASTGRLSSNDPNLQNIPIRTDEGRKIRQAFVPEKGWRLLSADYSQIELRLLAHVAGIQALKDAFRSGADIHAMTASQVFGIPIKGMDPNMRRKAKAINFGIIYGISAFGLARQLGIEHGEAAAYIQAYFEKYPGIKDYMERTKAQARKFGFVTTLFGRKVHIPEINERNPNRRGFAERAAINAPIQGGAADIIKRAMIRIPGVLDQAKLKARMLLQVHDELVFEVLPVEADATAALVKKAMEDAAQLDVPLVVDTGVGDNWDEAH